MQSQGRGEGPGAQTLDGCSVEVYKLQPYLDELDQILPLLPVQASILELGCGAGRLTKVLIEHGHQPTLIDNSQQMLDAVTLEVPKHLSDIETLNLDQQFDAIILASSLINCAEPLLMRQFLNTAARHLKATGYLYAERHDPQIMQSIEVGQKGVIGELNVEFTHIERHGYLTHITVRYFHGDEYWDHEFVTRTLYEDDIVAAFAESSMQFTRWVDDRKRWAQGTLNKVQTLVP